jgi:hypothetical protein
MIYMVEMDLLDTPRRAEWEAWYVAHQWKLLSIPGIRASQRFETIHPARSPFVALHQVDSADVFTSPAYRAQAGPGNTGEWQAKMDNWHRNLFDAASSPDVPMDARLVVVEDGAVEERHGFAETLRARGVQGAISGPPAIQWAKAVGLDRSVTRRGLAILPPATADVLAGTPGFRVLRPLGPRLVPPAV